jgi:hypothetical protein
MRPCYSISNLQNKTTTRIRSLLNQCGGRSIGSLVVEVKVGFPRSPIEWSSVKNWVNSTSQAKSGLSFKANKKFLSQPRATQELRCCPIVTSRFKTKRCNRSQLNQRGQRSSKKGTLIRSSNHQTTLCVPRNSGKQINCLHSKVPLKRRSPTSPIKSHFVKGVIGNSGVFCVISPS